MVKRSTTAGAPHRQQVVDRAAHLDRIEVRSQERRLADLHQFDGRSSNRAYRVSAYELFKIRLFVVPQTRPFAALDQAVRLEAERKAEGYATTMTGRIPGLSRQIRSLNIRLDLRRVREGRQRRALFLLRVTCNTPEPEKWSRGRIRISDRPAPRLFSDQ